MVGRYVGSGASRRFVLGVLLAVSLSVAGVAYEFPEPGDSAATGWGQDILSWATAVSASTLQKNGGTQTLTAELDFGASFGTKHLYVKSRTANTASAGQVRLARADVVSWRNQANSADLDLAVNSSNQLTFGGVALGLSAQPTFSDTSTVDLALNVNDVTASVIAGSLTNTHVNASAAIAVSKLAALTVSRAVVTDASGFLAASAATAVEVGYLSGVTSAIQTQLGTKLDHSGGTGIALTYSATQLRFTVTDEGATAARFDFRRESTTPAANDGIGELRFFARDSGANLETYAQVSVTADDVTNGSEDATIRFQVMQAGSFVEPMRLVGTSIRASGVTASRALVTDGSSNIAASATTATELGFVSGVTSAIQTQINTKLTTGTAALVNADVNAAAAIAVSKLAALTASRAVVTDGSGFLAASTATATEVGYLSGVTSSIQTQISSIVGGLTLLQVYSPAAIASLDITSQISATYDVYLVIFKLRPASDGVSLQIRTDTANGASFDAGGSDYSYHCVYNKGTTTLTGAGSAGATAIVPIASENVGNAANEGISGYILISSLGSASDYPTLSFHVEMLDTSTLHMSGQGGGMRLSAAAINALQLSFSVGNIAGGNAWIYGFKRTV